MNEEERARKKVMETMKILFIMTMEEGVREMMMDRKRKREGRWGRRHLKGLKS